MASKEKLSRLTIVVPTYERQDFALRFMNYWMDKGPSLIILDGSAAPISPANLSAFGSHIQYLHRRVGLLQRKYEGFDLVQTEYAVLAGDDEFYIPTAVEACIKELDGDDGLVACFGRVLGFSPKNQRVFGKPQYAGLEDYAVDANSAEERVVQHMRNYVPSLVYAICRTSQWKSAMKYSHQTDFPFFAAGELLFQMCMAYAGRSKVVPELIWLRSDGETEPIRGNEISLDETKRFPTWWTDSSKVKEHEEFISIMSSGFNDILPNQSGDLREVVVAGAEAYSEFYQDKIGLSSSMMLKRLAVKMIPDFAMPFLVRMSQASRLYKPHPNTELLQAGKALEATGVRVDFRELEEIEKTIINFHKN